MSQILILSKNFKKRQSETNPLQKGPVMQIMGEFWKGKTIFSKKSMLIDWQSLRVMACIKRWLGQHCSKIAKPYEMSLMTIFLKPKSTLNVFQVLGLKVALIVPQSNVQTRRQKNIFIKSWMRICQPLEVLTGVILESGTNCCRDGNIPYKSWVERAANSGPFGHENDSRIRKKSAKFEHCSLVIMNHQYNGEPPSA